MEPEWRSVSFFRNKTPHCYISLHDMEGRKTPAFEAQTVRDPLPGLCWSVSVTQLLHGPLFVIYSRFNV